MKAQAQNWFVSLSNRDNCSSKDFVLGDSKVDCLKKTF